MKLFASVCKRLKENVSQDSINAPLLLRFAHVLGEEMQARNWPREKCRQALCRMRRVMRKRNIAPAIIRAMKLPCAKKDFNSVIGKGFGRLAMQHPIRARLEGWIRTIKTKTHNHSDLSVRNIMSFVLGSVLPNMGWTLEHWPDSPAQEVPTRLNPDVVSKICSKAQTAKKLQWLQMFVTHILGSSFVVHCPELQTNSPKPAQMEHDIHRISREDLETLYVEAQKDRFDELFFLTLLSTGMRVGGFVKWKCAHAADIVEGRWRARAESQTLEKGNKMFSFKLHARVQELLGDWLNKQRTWHASEYVFPGKQGKHIGTNCIWQRFSNMCKRAKLQGPQFHPHALRHCYAHMLFELGNSVDVISKLINHTTSATTQKYYLKESAARVSERAYIPWFNPTSAASPVPAFLL